MDRTGETPVPTVQSGWKKARSRTRLRLAVGCVLAALAKIAAVSRSLEPPKATSGFFMPSAEYMQRALKLAEMGRGRTRTNPLVGAVLVKNGRVIGEGYHRAYGENHAEVDALAHASEPATGADLYVNLEPCSHYGKTPPCVDAIEQAGIRRVIVAMADPNPQVNGAGLDHLRAAGVEIVLGIGEEQARRLNEAYLKFVQTGLPFVTLKIAQTLDGKIADNAGNSKWITSEESRRRVHELRAHHDAILVGANTVRKDDPELTAHGQGNDPLRLVVTSRAEFFHAPRVLGADRREKTVLCSPNAVDTSCNELSWKIKGSEDKLELRELLRTAAGKGIASILVEGGKSIFSQFLCERLADKVILVIAPRLLGSGIAAFESSSLRSIDNTLNLEIRSVATVGTDIWVEAYPKA